MAKNLFITATEARCGKSLIAIGVMELLLRHIDKVGFFCPIIADKYSKKGNNSDIDLITSQFSLNLDYEKMYACTTSHANYLLSQGKHEQLIEQIITKYNEIENKFDFILCEGIEFEGSTASFEFDINAQISNNLGCPVLLVANGYKKTLDEIVWAVKVYKKSFDDKGCNVIATVLNRINCKDKEKIVQLLKKDIMNSTQLIYTICNDVFLEHPTVQEVVEYLGAKVLYGQKHLDQHISGFTVAAMHLNNFLPRIKHGILIITPGDRADVIVACLSAVSSISMPYIAGIVLTGGLIPDKPICKLIEGFDKVIPILSVKHNTFTTASILDKIHTKILPNDFRKIVHALGIFEENIDMNELGKKIIKTKSTIITPKMFEFGLIQKARKNKQHIILPEGEDERILRACEILLRRDAAKITLIGDKNKIKKKIIRLGLYLDDAAIIEPLKSEFYDEYAKTFYEIRKHKGITMDHARDIVADVNYFSTMMIYSGHGDAMVSGAAHTTSDTIRPALQIIKTNSTCSIVSSIFFMCLSDRVLVYGDCAINPDPDASQLAEIAVNSAKTAMIFGIEPNVAMLSYSTGKSGKGKNVEKVKKAVDIATRLSDNLNLKINIDGPIQYDAAVDPAVAKIKMPGSKVAGRASIFIFPDLNTGNNTYKAVQRSAKAVAIGPILQGLKEPVNDLSRGCLIPDIVNTVAITAIQAQPQEDSI